MLKGISEVGVTGKSYGYSSSIMQQAQAVRTTLCDSLQTRKKNSLITFFKKLKLSVMMEDGKHLCLLSSPAVGTGRPDLVIKPCISE